MRCGRWATARPPSRNWCSRWRSSGACCAASGSRTAGTARRPRWSSWTRTAVVGHQRRPGVDGAGGPKGLKAAAALADAVVYCLGPQPDMIQLVGRELDKAAAEAGRPEGSVKLISLTWFYLLRNGQTWEDAITEGFGSGPISSCLTNAGF